MYGYLSIFGQKKSKFYDAKTGKTALEARKRESTVIKRDAEHPSELIEVELSSVGNQSSSLQDRPSLQRIRVDGWATGRRLPVIAGRIGAGLRSDARLALVVDRCWFLMNHGPTPTQTLQYGGSPLASPLNTVACRVLRSGSVLATPTPSMLTGTR